MKNAEATTVDQTATVGEQAAHVAPEKAPSKKAATRKKSAPQGQKTAKGGKPKAAAPKKATKAGNKAGKPTSAKKASTPRAESKGAKILEMIGRAKGTTLAEIMKAVQWQAHSVRGFISTAGKKQGDLNRVREERRQRSRLQDSQVGTSPSRPYAAAGSNDPAVVLLVALQSTAPRPISKGTMEPPQ